MRQLNRTRRPAKGFTLIEILVVVSIIAALIFFLTRNSEKAEQRTALNAVSTQLVVLSDAIKSTYRSNNYGGLTVQNLCESRAVSEMCSGTGAASAIRHDFQGTVAIAPANCNGGTSNCFTFAPANIPGNACAPIISSLQGKASAITVGTTVVKNASTAYSQAAVNTACNSNFVTITFTST